MNFEQQNFSNNGISKPPEGIGDGRYLSEITLPVIQPASKKYTCRDISLGCALLYTYHQNICS